MNTTHARSTGLALCLMIASGCSKHSDSTAPATGGSSTPDATVSAEFAAGERLFREHRFAQFFAAQSGGDVNAPVVIGDPALAFLAVGGSSQPGPFAGSTQSCASCHMTDQASDMAGAGARALNDFAVRVRLTERPGGERVATRNVPALVDAASSHDRAFDADGEFATFDAAVEAALLGRKFGWLADERNAAATQLAAVIRSDDGTGPLATEYGAVSYATLLDPSAAGVPAAFVLPPNYRIDVATASDEQLIDAVVALIGAYLEAYRLNRDATGAYSGSPYDAFLTANALPNQPAAGEQPLEYARRLRAELEALTAPVFVDEPTAYLDSHDQAFVFGPLELEGLRSFLAEPGAAGAVGNCVACHAPPSFSDNLFHNTGVSQSEYDRVHGDGSFMQLAVPNLATRNSRPGLYLPADASHPLAPSSFRHRVSIGYPDLTDLGLWNVFANPTMPTPQADLRADLVAVYGASVNAMADAELLPLTEALFRTPSLRNLGESAPYGHDGAFANLGVMLDHYLEAAQLARQGFLRNGDSRLAAIDLTAGQLPALAAFLRSLNEEFEVRSHPAQ